MWRIASRARSAGSQLAGKARQLAACHGGSAAEERCVSSGGGTAGRQHLEQQALRPFRLLHTGSKPAAAAPAPAARGGGRAAAWLQQARSFQATCSGLQDLSLSNLPSSDAAPPLLPQELPEGTLVARTKGLFEDQEVPVTSFAGDDRGTAILGGDVFDVPIRPDIVHRVVKWQLAKRRQGTHSTKGVGEVRGTSRKPWPQKGTGKARAGSLRGPHFRGGATMHGPKPRSHAFDLPKRIRRLGLKVALSARMAEGKLLVYDSLEPSSNKTKDMVQHVASALEGSKKVLFVDANHPAPPALLRSTSNLHYVNVLPARGLNVYSILQHDTLVMGLGAVRSIEERLRSPIRKNARPEVTHRMHREQEAVDEPKA